MYNGQNIVMSVVMPIVPVTPRENFAHHSVAVEIDQDDTGHAKNHNFNAHGP